MASARKIPALMLRVCPARSLFRFVGNQSSPERIRFLAEVPATLVGRVSPATNFELVSQYSCPNVQEAPARTNTSAKLRDCLYACSTSRPKFSTTRCKQKS
jgi:hypothetical protein